MMTETYYYLSMLACRHALYILGLIACTLALRCYVGETKNNGKPNSTQVCMSAKYCLKKTRKSGIDSIHLYGCDDLSDCRRSILDIFGMTIFAKGRGGGGKGGGGKGGGGKGRGGKGGRGKRGRRSKRRSPTKKSCLTKNKVTKCCCKKDLCNGLEQVPAFAALVTSTMFFLNT
ncbi:unnamed protein product [Cylicocyclus nassatus]|uniref:Uncharacterized protein n=1 Tax=Cylicocyclus nassatus TaxID=53992 RepID=A0AA36GU06_CYLNA|nr:unnamed protein product [Cylicocyclus nassatus]